MRLAIPISGAALAASYFFDPTAAWNARNTTLRLLDGLYRFDFPSAKPKPEKGPAALSLLIGDDGSADGLDDAVRRRPEL